MIQKRFTVFLCWVTGYLLQASLLTMAQESPPATFREAKKVMARIYADHKQTFYCGCRFERKGKLKAAEQTFQEDFAGRCLPFDDLTARDYAAIVAERQRQGRPITVEDAQIAAIAKSCGLMLATRNVKDFKGVDDLTVMNPWD